MTINEIIEDDLTPRCLKLELVDGCVAIFVGFGLGRTVFRGIILQFDFVNNLRSIII
jgi:hypothetical protein